MRFFDVPELVLKSAAGASTCDLVLSVSLQCFLEFWYGRILGHFSVFSVTS